MEIIAVAIWACKPSGCTLQSGFPVFEFVSLLLKIVFSLDALASAALG